MRHPIRFVLSALLAVPAAAQQGEGTIPPVQPAATIRPAPAPAQGPGQEELKRRRAAKLAKEVFQKAPWTLDYDQARELARKEGKLLLVYFTRSYAGCAPCDQLESQVLATTEFAEWSRQVVLFLHNTSHVDDEPYPELLFQMGGVGFPTVSFLDADGNLLQQVGHVTPLAQLDESLQRLRAWQALRREVEQGAPIGKQKELFLLELGLGNRPFAEMQRRHDELLTADDERAAVRQQMVNLQFREILRRTPRSQQESGGEQFVAMWRQGRIPDLSTETSFWQYMFAFAAAKRDVPLFTELLADVKRRKEGDPRLARYLQQLEEQLAKLETGKGG